MPGSEVEAVGKLKNFVQRPANPLLLDGISGSGSKEGPNVSERNDFAGGDARSATKRSVRVRLKRISSALYLDSGLEWVFRKDDARVFGSLTDAMDWCVQQNLGAFCFVLDSGNREIILNPFDFDKEGRPRTQWAHIAMIMLENAVLRRERQLLRAVMDAILVQANHRRQRTCRSPASSAPPRV